MKAVLGHEELWVVLIDGTHSDAEEIEVPAQLYERCVKAQDEFLECCELLAELHRPVYQRREARRRRDYVRRHGYADPTD